MRDLAYEAIMAKGNDTAIRFHTDTLGLSLNLREVWDMGSKISEQERNLQLIRDELVHIRRNQAVKCVKSVEETRDEAILDRLFDIQSAIQQVDIIIADERQLCAIRNTNYPLASENFDVMS